MRKILVIGCPGSGKSTFSRALHEKTCIPLCHLDMLYWAPDRTPVPKPVFLERLAAALAGDEWIIDGNYGSTLELRLAACDTVFFLDYPTEVCLAGARERRGTARPDMPRTEPADEEDEEFLGFIRRYAAESRPAVLELLGRHPEKAVFVFGSRAEADAFLRGLPENT